MNLPKYQDLSSHSKKCPSHFLTQFQIYDLFELLIIYQFFGVANFILSFLCNYLLLSIQTLLFFYFVISERYMALISRLYLYQCFEVLQNLYLPIDSLHVWKHFRYSLNHKNSKNFKIKHIKFLVLHFYKFWALLYFPNQNNL